MLGAYDLLLKGSQDCSWIPLYVFILFGNVKCKFESEVYRLPVSILIDYTFFKDLFYFLIAKSDMQRGGETERKIFRLIIHSPSERNSHCCTDLKPGYRKFFWVSHTDAGPQDIGPSLTLSQATSRTNTDSTAFHCLHLSNRFIGNVSLIWMQG